MTAGTYLIVGIAVLVAAGWAREVWLSRKLRARVRADRVARLAAEVTAADAVTELVLWRSMCAAALIGDAQDAIDRSAPFLGGGR